MVVATIFSFQLKFNSSYDCQGFKSCVADSLSPVVKKRIKHSIH